MSIAEPSSQIKTYGWMLLLLLAAVFLRLHQIAAIPPGLTHDEADHGLTAWSILSAGVRDLYFTIGYGREPLYDYANALLMTFLGPTFLAGRMSSVYFSLILIAGMAAWVWRAFDRKAAVLAAAGLAVGFWPVMAGRQSLRSIVLPALFVLAAAVFWRGLESAASGRNKTVWPFLTAGILLGLTFYAYIPARAMWIIFPALLLYLFFSKRELFRKVWSRTALMLLVMALVALPLLVYLVRNPTAEVRIAQLASPLSAVLAGDFGPLLENARGALRLFVNEGDLTWRYNIAGRPLLGTLMGLLFVLGLLMALWYMWQRKQDLRYGAASFFALSWLAAGFLPVLITGPALSMTQGIGMQPVLYLFPALGLLAVGQMRIGSRRIAELRGISVFVVLLFAAVAGTTYRDYFLIWANEPEVRVQYEATTVAALNYLNSYGQGTAAISSVTPDRYHSPAVAQMILHNDEVDLRWFDARQSLLLPQMESGQVFIPGFTPPAAALEPYLATAVWEESVPMRENDLDRPLDIYRLNRAQTESDWRQRLNAADGVFGDAAALVGYELKKSEASPGDEFDVVTLWQVRQPVEGAVIFMHLVAPAGPPIAQADQIGVPGYSWQPGDLFLQVHHLVIPADAPPGRYPLAAGIYTQDDGLRLSLTDGDQSGDAYTFGNVVVTP